MARRRSLGWNINLEATCLSQKHAKRSRRAVTLSVRASGGLAALAPPSSDSIEVMTSGEVVMAALPAAATAGGRKTNNNDGT